MANPNENRTFLFSDRILIWAKQKRFKEIRPLRMQLGLFKRQLSLESDLSEANGNQDHAVSKQG